MQGKTINGFELKRLLGTGGMAEVWLAENKIGKKAAVKLLLPKFCADEVLKARFLTEAKIMVGLNHPNIRQVYDYGELDGRPAIIMEYLEGDDLRSRMKNGQRFTEEELERWWNQVVDALNYTHKQNIIHRDIKPANIFIDQKGDAKLLDFGIAKVADTTSGTLTGSALGTRIYMSPAQVKDPKRVDYRTDIYSLAVSFVHLLTGKAPYDTTTDSDYEIQVSIVTKPIDLSEVPDGWRDFLTPYLYKEPEKRPMLKHFEEVQSEKNTTNNTDDTTLAENEKQEAKPTPMMRPKVTKEQPSKSKGRIKNKKGLWIGIGVAAAAVALIILLSLPKGNQPFAESDITDTLSVCVKEEISPIEELASGDLNVTINGVSFLMKRVEGGTFRMGSDFVDGSIRWDDEKPIHNVTVNTFYIGEIEVTQALWKAVMGNNPSEWRGDSLPVETVSWYDAVEYCNRLSKALGLRPYYEIDKSVRDLNSKSNYDDKKYKVTIDSLANGFRLPTEAEWEYAARGGNKSNGYLYAGSNFIDEVAWYEKNSSKRTHVVKQKQPNELGLFDMSGNVAEWCNDWFTQYPKKDQINPKGNMSGWARIHRGRHWDVPAEYCRVCNRSSNAPATALNCFGFRLCLSQELSLSGNHLADSIARLQELLVQEQSWEQPESEKKEDAAYEQCTTVVGCKNYLKAYPQGRYVDEVQAKKAELEKQAEERKNQKVENKGTDGNNSANGHEYVDLGLPSGTLWATCNVGANKPEDYGDYYAWGETSTRYTYDWNFYKYANGAYNKLTKYCNNSNYGNNGFTDNLTTLQSGDDPATANWGRGWQTPSSTQWEELLSNTTRQWTTKNGVKGSLFTSKKNGQTIFLPAAGHRWVSDFCNVGSRGDYWSRSLKTDNPFHVWCFYFDSDDYHLYGYNRSGGSSVRAVRSVRQK